MSDVLTQICTKKSVHVEAQKSRIPLNVLEESIQNAKPVRGFISALKQTLQNGDIPPLIAEVKKASPSKGSIREDFNPVQIAKSYEIAGASCLSVLTDTPYFQGQDQYLQDIQTHVSLPLLRKDFMIDPYQIYESRALGADCILLIAAALDDHMMQTLYDLTADLGMDALIEVHDAAELERALKLSPKMIGVNSRNLKTLSVDIETAHKMLMQMPGSVLKIAESGIHTHDDILSLQASGADGFLVGESLMRQDNIESATKKLLGTN